MNEKAKPRLRIPTALTVVVLAGIGAVAATEGCGDSTGSGTGGTASSQSTSGGGGQGGSSSESSTSSLI